MDRERLPLWVTAHQRIGTEHLNCLTKQKDVRSHRLEDGTKEWRAHRQDLFCNGIRSQVRTQAQQVGGGWILRFDPLKGERPGSGYWGRMIGNQPSALLQQASPMLLIDVPVTG